MRFMPAHEILLEAKKLRRVSDSLNVLSTQHAPLAEALSILSSEKDREILSSVKREMQEPRQTTSVREALAFEAAPAAKVQVVHSARA